MQQAVLQRRMQLPAAVLLLLVLVPQLHLLLLRLVLRPVLLSRTQGVCSFA